MASIIRVGQSKFVIVPIDEDSSERIMNCIQTLSELQDKPVVHEIFLKDTKAAYSKMINAQEKKAAESSFVIEEGIGGEGAPKDEKKEEQKFLGGLGLKFKFPGDPKK